MSLLNYRDGKPHLQAMAHLAIGIDTPGFDAAQLREASRLAPTSAAACFYLGKYLYGKRDPGAKAALQRAVELGDDQATAAAQEYLKLMH